MSRRTARVSPDLALTAAACIVSFVLALLPIGGLARGVALVPLVLILPGYAVVAAMFPPRTIGGAERLVYSVSVSFGAASITGLFWQLVLELDRFAWVLLLTLVTLAGTAIAQRRRIATPQRARQPKLQRPGWPTAIAIAIGIGIAGGAIGLAGRGLKEQRGKAQFGALWILPGQGATGVEVGISNHFGSGHGYRLLIDRDGRVLRDLRLRLGPHQGWRTKLAASEFDGPKLPGGGILVATLYKDGKQYRRAAIEPGVGT